MCYYIAYDFIFLYFCFSKRNITHTRFRAKENIALFTFLFISPFYLFLSVNTTSLAFFSLRKRLVYSVTALRDLTHVTYSFRGGFASFISSTHLYFPTRVARERSNRLFASLMTSRTNDYATTNIATFFRKYLKINIFIALSTLNVVWLWYLFHS